MARRYQSLESWISEAMIDDSKDKPCTAFSLMYVKPNDSEQEIHTIDLTKKAQEPANLAKVFQRRAEGFAQDLDGISTFRLLAFYGTKDPEAMHPFKCIDGEIRNSAAGIVLAESPDQKGITQQLMKHLERREEMMVGFIQTVVVRNMEERSSLQKEVNDAYNIVREMMMKQFQLEHDKQIERMKFERESAERKAIMQLLPGLLNTVTGTEVVPQSVADSSLIDAIARKVPENTLKMLLGSGAVPAELAAPLLARLNQTLERDKKEAEEVKKLPPANRDGALDAQGN